MPPRRKRCAGGGAQKGADVSGARAVFGFNQTMEMRKACGRLMQQVDAVISPVNPIVSYPADWASPTNDPQRPFIGLRIEC